jgi:hypothetical protein
MGLEILIVEPQPVPQVEPADEAVFRSLVDWIRNGVGLDWPRDDRVDDLYANERSARRIIERAGRYWAKVRQMAPTGIEMRVERANEPGRGIRLSFQWTKLDPYLGQYVPVERLCYPRQLVLETLPGFVLQELMGVAELFLHESCQ